MKNKRLISSNVLDYTLCVVFFFFNSQLYLRNPNEKIPNLALDSKIKLPSDQMSILCTKLDFL